MHQLSIFSPRVVAADTHLLAADLPLPGMGHLAVNAYFIRAQQPTLVDTGLPALREEFITNLEGLVPLEQLRYIVLTHADSDHTGALRELLRLAPRAQVVTNFLGMGKLNLLENLEPQRVFLINPGQGLSLGDRELRALRPPTYDAPETMAFLDTQSGALLSSDSFGALLQTHIDDATQLDEATLETGVRTWASIDAPWLADADAQAFHGRLDALRRLQPSCVLSSHLAPAHGMMGRLCDALGKAHGVAPFVGPDQAALLAQLGAA